MESSNKWKVFRLINYKDGSKKWTKEGNHFYDSLQRAKNFASGMHFEELKGSNEFIVKSTEGHEYHCRMNQRATLKWALNLKNMIDDAL